MKLRNKAAKSGSSPAPCSPSLETPETDHVWSETLRWCHARDEYHDPQHAALANLCTKLERERNAAYGSLREMIDLNETTGDPDPEITDRARALLPENK